MNFYPAYKSFTSDDLIFTDDLKDIYNRFI